MKRVIVYVDGFNLYFGLRSKGWRRHYWLDLVKLAEALLKPDQQLAGVHYFTSRIRSNAHNLADMQRQNSCCPMRSQTVLTPHCSFRPTAT